MKKVHLAGTLTALFLVGTSSFAIDYKNLLVTGYKPHMVSQALLPDRAWIPYPSYTNRSAWEKLPEELRKEAIRNGEQLLGYNWPSIKATDYLAFTRTGNRDSVDEKNYTISRNLRSLLFAELMEGKGRFIDDIINGIFNVCERTYWGQAAHFYLYGYDGSIDKPTTILPDVENQIIDLMTGDLAGDLAWIWYFLHNELDKVSPIISRRIKYEIQNKVLHPFYTRSDFWWMYGWTRGATVNNWNPWCNYNVLTCILLLEDDPVKKATGIYKSLSTIDVFLNTYPPDGSCSEGPGYWGGAVGRLFTYLDLIYKATNGKVTIYDNKKLSEMAKYIYRVYISNGTYYTNYADSPVRNYWSRNPGSLYHIGARINDPTLQSFAAFLQKSSTEKDQLMRGRIGETLENLFNPVDWAGIQLVEPLISQYFFPNWDVVIARDKEGSTDGFYFTAKGGSNGEDHNHNDVGTFMLYYNGEPVFIDVGVGTYTKQTFGQDRYSIWNLQSNYHNVPVINGLGQVAGHTFIAQHSKYTPTKNQITYSTDISKAYGADTKVKSWVRSYTLERGKQFLISDTWQLEENKGGNTTNFMSILPCRIVKPGIIELTGNGFSLYLKYDVAAYKERIEEIKIDDPKLLKSVGEKVFRIVFELQNKSLSGNAVFEVTKVK